MSRCTADHGSPFDQLRVSGIFTAGFQEYEETEAQDQSNPDASRRPTEGGHVLRTAWGSER